MENFSNSSITHEKLKELISSFELAVELKDLELYWQSEQVNPKEITYYQKIKGVNKVNQLIVSLDDYQYFLKPISIITSNKDSLIKFESMSQDYCPLKNFLQEDYEKLRIDGSNMSILCNNITKAIQYVKSSPLKILHLNLEKIIINKNTFEVKIAETGVYYNLFLLGRYLPSNYDYHNYEEPHISLMSVEKLYGQKLYYSLQSIIYHVLTNTLPFGVLLTKQDCLKEFNKRFDLSKISHLKGELQKYFYDVLYGHFTNKLELAQPVKEKVNVDLEIIVQEEEKVNKITEDLNTKNSVGNNSLSESMNNKLFRNDAEQGVSSMNRIAIANNHTNVEVSEEKKLDEVSFRKDDFKIWFDQYSSLSNSLSDKLILVKSFKHTNELNREYSLNVGDQMTLYYGNTDIISILTHLSYKDQVNIININCSQMFNMKTIKILSITYTEKKRNETYDLFLFFTSKEQESKKFLGKVEILILDQMININNATKVELTKVFSEKSEKMQNIRIDYIFERFLFVGEKESKLHSICLKKYLDFTSKRDNVVINEDETIALKQFLLPKLEGNSLSYICHCSFKNFRKVSEYLVLLCEVKNKLKRKKMIFIFEAHSRDKKNPLLVREYVNDFKFQKVKMHKTNFMGLCVSFQDESQTLYFYKLKDLLKRDFVLQDNNRKNIIVSTTINDKYLTWEVLPTNTLMIMHNNQMKVDNLSEDISSETLTLKTLLSEMNQDLEITIQNFHIQYPSLQIINVWIITPQLLYFASMKGSNEEGVPE